MRRSAGSRTATSGTARSAPRTSQRERSDSPWGLLCRWWWWPRVAGCGPRTQLVADVDGRRGERRRQGHADQAEQTAGSDRDYEHGKWVQLQRRAEHERLQDVLKRAIGQQD